MDVTLQYTNMTSFCCGCVKAAEKSINLKDNSHTRQSNTSSIVLPCRSLLICLLLVELLCQVLPYSNAAPAVRRTTRYPRWNTPCGGQNQLIADENIWEAVTLPPIPNHKHYEKLSRDALEAKARAEDLMTKYMTQRFDNNPDIEDEVEDIMLKGMPKVPAITRASLDVESVEPVKSLHSTFADLARIAVFVEQVRLDERVHEEKEAVNFINEIQLLENQYIYGLLCQVKVTMRYHNISPDPLITREVMSEEFKDLKTDALRHLRDFIIIRDFKKLLHHIGVSFMVLRDQHMPDEANINK